MAWIGSIGLSHLSSIVGIAIKYECALLQLVFLHDKSSHRRSRKGYGYQYLYSIYPEDRWARVTVYSQALIFQMWDKPHYRATSLQQDMKDNLRNVAIPGTGVPLSIFCTHWILCLLCLLVVNPLICFCGAVNKVMIEHRSGAGSGDLGKKLVTHFRNHLLRPDDWFSFWRLNCQLVSYHSLTRQNSPGYKQEDKWTFLKEGKEAGVPVSPFMEIEAIVCKNKNIEGGMGIHFFKVIIKLYSAFMLMGYGLLMCLECYRRW
jgi:hypothetical protein